MIDDDFRHSIVAGDYDAINEILRQIHETEQSIKHSGGAAYSEKSNTSASVRASHELMATSSEVNRIC